MPTQTNKPARPAAAQHPTPPPNPAPKPTGLPQNQPVFPAQQGDPESIPMEPEYVPMSGNELLAPSEADSQLRDMATNPPDSVLGMSDIAIPRLVLAQPTSVFEGATEHPGQWFNSVTGDFQELMRIVVVRVTIQRAVFPDPYDPNVPVACASPDGLMPYQEYMDREVENIQINGACAECPLSQWGEADPITGKGAPPRCSLMYLYTGLEADSGMPFSLRLKGTALTTARKLNFLWQQYRHNIVLLLGSQQGKSTTGRKYYVPTIAMAKEATPDFIKDMAVQMMGQIQTKHDVEPPTTAPAEDDIPF